MKFWDKSLEARKTTLVVQLFCSSPSAGGEKCSDWELPAAIFIITIIFAIIISTIIMSFPRNDDADADANNNG